MYSIAFVGLVIYKLEESSDSNVSLNKFHTDNFTWNVQTLLTIIDLSNQLTTK